MDPETHMVHWKSSWSQGTRQATGMPLHETGDSLRSAYVP